MEECNRTFAPAHRKHVRATPIGGLRAACSARDYGRGREGETERGGRCNGRLPFANLGFDQSGR